jgi:hypothetical protein
MSTEDERTAHLVGFRAREAAMSNRRLEPAPRESVDMTEAREAVVAAYKDVLGALDLAIDGLDHPETTLSLFREDLQRFELAVRGAGTPGGARNRELATEVTLCQHSHEEAVDGTCPVHGGDACLRQYAPGGESIRPEYVEHWRALAGLPARGGSPTEPTEERLIQVIDATIYDCMELDENKQPHVGTQWREMLAKRMLETFGAAPGERATE